MRITFLLILLLSTFLGCVKRKIAITSYPSGALVWVNDREVGRTPITFEFTYYGEYDIRLLLENYEPIMTSAWTQQPIWDAPLVDFISDVAPINLESNTLWHFDLEQPRDNPEKLLERAKILRAKTLEDNGK
jgi:hypothetical protein|tara:strand:+ start:389 stop:784 length:396 start_codon:yes stop_codon:yes gene_type:complete